MNGYMDIYTVIFLVLAVVIFLRLRSVLGRRTGNERPPFDPYARREAPKPAATGDDKVVSLPRRSADIDSGKVDAENLPEERVKTIAPAGSSLNEALLAIARADRSFKAADFLNGAKAAYEMIVTAYAEGDRKTLKNLLSKDVYDGFVAAVGQRESAGQTMEFKFVGIDKADITDAAMRNGTAQVTVRFLSKLISATHDKDGKVVDGDPVAVTDVTDIWTFARDTNSRDPNWKLIATESVE
jgi:predicted lipid-binding transport protein (Tim44 family)